MGSAASSNVKEISIKQSGDGKRDQHKGHRSSSSLSKRSASSLSEKLLHGLGSANSEKRRNDEIRVALAITEKKLAEAEEKIRTLQRELSALELRNNELVTEINWLKQQVAQPDAPSYIRSPRPTTAVVSDAAKELREELEYYRNEMEDEQKRHQDRMLALRREFAVKIAIIQEELINEKLLNKKLNEKLKLMMAKEDVEENKNTSLSTSPSSQFEKITQNSSAISSTSPNEGIYSKERSSSVEEDKSENSFRNVYTLSESMEVIKVIETPRPMNSGIRLATPAHTIDSDEVSGIVTSMDVLKQDNSSPTTLQQRRSSAPVLFKSLSRINRRQHSLETTNDVDDHSDDSTTYNVKDVSTISCRQQAVEQSSSKQ